MADTVEIKLKVDSTGAVQSIETTGGAVVKLGTKVDDLGKKTMSFGRIVDTAIGNIAANAIGRLSQALSDAAGGIIRVGSQAQQKLAELSAITGIAGADLERLGDTAVRESMRTGVAAADQVEAFKLLASNIDIATIGGVAGLENLGREVVTLSQAAGVDLAQAANVVAGSINSFGLEASEGARAVNALAAGSKFGAAEVADLGASLKNAGATAAGANVSFEETIGATEVLSQNFVKGGEAGTGLRNVISIIQTESKKLAAAGIKDVNIESEGLSKSLGRLTPLLDDAAALSRIFGRENQSIARILIANADAVGEMTDKVTGTNTAQEQAAIQTATFQGAVSRLMATIEGVGIAIFQEYSDELTGIIEGTIDAIRFLTEHKDVILETGKALAIIVASVTAYNAAVKAQTIVTQAAAIAQRLLNTAMKLNPIGLIVAGLTALVLLLIKFRDRVADAAAVFVDFGIAIVRSMRSLGEALGIDAAVRGADIVIEKLEGISDRLRSYAQNVRDAKAEDLGGEFGGAGAGAEFAAGEVDKLTDAIDRNTESKKRNKAAAPDRPGIPIAGQGPGSTGAAFGEDGSIAELDALVSQFGKESLIAPETLNDVDKLIELFTNLRNSAKLQDVRDDHAKTIERLNELKNAMLGVADASVEASEKQRKAAEASLASTIASVQATRNVGASAVAAAKEQASQIINAEIGKAIAKAVASIPFPLNLVLGAAAGASVKALIKGLTGFAAGGLVGGSGGTDSQIIRATPGEFVVNPTATRENRGILEEINSGAGGTLRARINLTGRLTMDRATLVAGIEEEQLIVLQTRGEA